MFHKEPAIMKNWAQYGNAYYAALQREILPEAVRMLAPGGHLLYSTCTFSPIEDERMVEELLAQEPDLELVPIEKAPGVDDGHPEWSVSGREDLVRCARFWPHRLRGQGHFVALFHKKGETAEHRPLGGGSTMPKQFEAWVQKEMKHFPGNILSNEDGYILLGEKLYYSSLPMERLNGLRVLRNGIFLGELCKDRFEPAQAWAMTLKEENIKSINLPLGDARTVRYLKGETLTGDAPNGWNLILTEGYPLGWAKSSGSTIKNKYLKAWKMN
jgi:NOL1/NOP2/fmu family ribosome biogenesis protein